MIRASLRAAALAATALICGCQTLSTIGGGVSSGFDAARGWAPTFLAPYRPDVHQGNIVTQEMIDQLRIGMTREQVRFLLGTPLLTSEFHKERWDYVFYLNPRRGETQSRRLTVLFKDNRVDRFVADPMPPETLADSLILGPDAKRPARAAPRQPEKVPDIQTPPPGRE